MKEIYTELFELLKNHENKEFMEKVNNLLENNGMFDINIYDDDDKQFLNYAVVMNNIEMVEFLVGKNIRLDTENEDIPLFTIPIYYNYMKILQILLEADKKNIGKSLVNYRDKFYKTPLHHAIYTKNIEAIDILLKYGANVDISDKDKYNSLFYAIKSRNIDIFKKIIKYTSDINAKCITGENGLHIACNLQLYEIATLLIKNKININVHDNSNELTPLHYCVLLNNIKLSMLLITNGANLNLQDIYGNTVLHYSIIENNYEIFNELLAHGKKNNNININLWNIEGEIPFHLIFKLKREKWGDLIDPLIEKSNLNMQDKNGNSCLYYLAEFGLWKDYVYVLKKKKMNIFLKNKKKKHVFDVVDPKNHELFFGLLADSYLYLLKNTGKQWTENWDIVCAKSLPDLSEEEKNIIKQGMIENKMSAESLNSPLVIKLCKNVIINKIKKLIKNIQNKKELKCYEKSFPMIKPSVCISVSEGKDLQFCTFTGGLLDILMGLVFLIKKHGSDVCSILADKINKNDLCYKYKLNDIISHNNKCELVSFEIIWTNKKLFFEPHFVANFMDCLKSKKRFIIIPIGIEMKEGSHAGYLIYDKELKELERFETYGGGMSLYGTYYDSPLLDEKLELKFKSIDENIQYISPHKYLPKISFQLMDIIEKGKKKIGDPFGFCALWGIWYVDHRIMYKDIPRDKLVKILIDNIKEKGGSFKNIIRNYAVDIIEIRDKVLSKSNLDINDWINDQYTDEQFISVLDEINNEIQDSEQ